MSGCFYASYLFYWFYIFIIIVNWYSSTSRDFAEAFLTWQHQPRSKRMVLKRLRKLYYYKHVDVFEIKIWHICLRSWNGWWMFLCNWYRFPDAEKLSPPILQLDEVTFYYNKDKPIFNNVNLSTSMDSRICIVSHTLSFGHITYL